MLRPLLYGVMLSTLAVVPCARVAWAGDGPPTGIIAVQRTSAFPSTSALASGDIQSTVTRVVAFRQREPNDGAEPSLPTMAYLGFDDMNLYVAFVCQENPTDLRAHLSRREDILEDEVVSVSIDTFRDGRHAYVFYANARGVQLDGLIAEGGDDDYAFDTVWTSEASITATGFIVRFAIPFKSLRYASGEARSWGIALGRYRPASRELVTWPYMTSSIDAYIPQFALLTGLDGLPRGVHSRLVPFGTAASEQYLDQSGSDAVTRTATATRAGLDAKISAGAEWMIDLAANPDFSQVESDEPQVTTNQRYEVLFPERRPFFTDRANFFETPEPIFFSRRVVDPQLGGRVTGTSGAWTVGALIANDRATGRGGSSVTVGRAQRLVGAESTFGVMVTNRHADAQDDAMVSTDVRLKLDANWILTAQAMRSQSGQSGPGTGLFAELRHAGRHLTYYSNYRDRSEGFSVPLGYIPRIDMRQMKHVAGYKWRPAGSAIVSVGPSALGLVNWSHDRTLQDASIDVPLWIDVRGPASIAVGRKELFERYAGIPFRRHETYAYVSAQVTRGLGIDANWSSGTAINYFPAAPFDPFVGNAVSASLALTWRPSPRLRLSETYLFSRLRSPAPGRATAFEDHVTRIRASYQFTREWSLRAIIDASLLEPSSALVAFERTRRMTVDVLATYLLHPGAALYVGVTNQQENLTVDQAARSVRRIDGRGLVTGRRLFVKMTYDLSF